MRKRSDKSIAEILTPMADTASAVAAVASSRNALALATEGFTTTKFCELVLRDRNRLSKENALTICQYIIAMKREVNPRLSHKVFVRVIKGCWD